VPDTFRVLLSQRRHWINSTIHNLTELVLVMQFVVAGDNTHTGDKEGESDNTHIVMKRWAEFERERRWKSGTTSHEDLVYNDRKCVFFFFYGGSLR
jgi:hypothetical protein